MKGFYLLLAGLCVASLSGQNARASEPSPSIVGTWLGTDDVGVKGGFVFRADGTADMVRNGESFKDTVVKHTGTITYKFNDSVTPYQLDIVVTRNGGASNALECIVEFPDADHLRMRQPNNGPRPKDFNNAQKNEVILLSRTKTEKS